MEAYIHVTMHKTRDCFLTDGPIAVVGVSNRAGNFGRTIYTTLKKAGYDVLPVNPNTQHVVGDVCYPSLHDLPEKAKAVVCVTNPTAALPIVDDAIAVGVDRIWFQQGADFSKAAANAEKAGMWTVTGRCILMYAQPVTGLHAFHRFLSRLFGRV